MVLKTIAGLQEKNGDGYSVSAMESHANGLTAGYTGYHGLKAGYGLTGTKPAAKTHNTLG
jgi:hypothetical protein